MKEKIKEEFIRISYPDPGEKAVEEIFQLAERFVKEGWILRRSRRKINRMIKKNNLRIARDINSQKIIGFCACKILNLERAELHFLVAKKGRPFVAERLIKSWLSTLRILKFKTVFLTTKKDNRLRNTVFKRSKFEEIPLWQTPWQVLLPLLFRLIFLRRKSIAMKRDFSSREAE